MKYIYPKNPFKRIAFFIRRHLLVVINISILLAILFIVIKYASASLNQTLNYQEVIIASQDIPKDAVISENQLTWQKFLTGHLPQHAYFDGDQIIGKKALVNIKSGDVLTPSLIGTDTSNTARLTALIDKDKTIFTLNNKDVHALPNILEVGNTVSIFSVDVKGDKKIRLLENVRVVEITRSVDKKSGGEISSISLELNNDDDTKLSEAIAKEWFLELVIEPYKS